MKRLVVLLLLLGVCILACGKKGDVIKLQKDTPAYALAKALSEKLPFLDPDKNNKLIICKAFTITTGEVMRAIYDNSGSRAEQLKNIDVNRVKEIILQSARGIAEQKLVLNEIKRSQFVASEPEIDSLMNMQYQRYGGEAQFKQLVTQSGANYESVNRDMRNVFLIDQYLESILGDKLDVSEEEVASVRHILLSTQGKSEAEKKVIHQKMMVVLIRARAGEDFAELVKEYSEDPGSKNNGGLYENFPRGTMVKPFEDAAFSVPVGELSDIIETNYGYHILKVVDRKKIKELNPPNPDLEDQLKAKKKPQLFQEYMKKIKEEQGYKEIEF
ncbi:MAG: peptidylprolyl isomerase [candidate division KSB1 bacterium]|nr:peptidylprolyl isomerase [candidate division KSB1 bacterium]MDZ7334177.1 peptidylprolyl isomerase [candidate division KSB1 bacterium]MDZ7357316.1 peptidylprolyl isomerase [candidate division KSB1 bacterium]MDZ7377376.1 peptidylprolyl isomerase [candidate division KSB1 bacterium]MDZ7400870.1 peptidylprolyl isomerase [candidate division KSB1 bacterium]